MLKTSLRIAIESTNIIHYLLIILSINNVIVNNIQIFYLDMNWSRIVKIFRDSKPRYIAARVYAFIDTNLTPVK